MNYVQRCPKCGQMNAYWVTVCIRCTAKLPNAGAPTPIPIQAPPRPVQAPPRRGYCWLIAAAFLVPMFGLIGGGLAMLLGDDELREVGYTMIAAAIVAILIAVALVMIAIVLAGPDTVLRGV